MHVGNTTYARGDILPALRNPRDTISTAHFTSCEAMMRHVESRSRDDAWCTDPWSQDVDFTGTIDMPHAFRLCENGWQEGAEMVSRLRDKIVATAPVGARMTRWDVGGAYPSVPRALAGNPMHMRRIDSSAIKRKPVITIVHHMGGTSNIEAKCFLNKAAVMAALVDVIEATGYQVEILAASVCREKSAKLTHETVFTVKEAGQPVDIGRLAFGLGHVAAFRRLVFSVRSLNEFNKPLTSALGTTTDYGERPDGIYVLPSLNTCSDAFRTESRAASHGLKRFIHELHTQGCPAFPEPVYT